MAGVNSGQIVAVGVNGGQSGLAGGFASGQGLVRTVGLGTGGRGWTPSPWGDSLAATIAVLWCSHQLVSFLPGNIQWFLNLM